MPVFHRRCESQGRARQAVRELLEGVEDFHARGVGEVHQRVVVGWRAAAAGKALDDGDEASVEAEEDGGEGGVCFSYSRRKSFLETAFRDEETMWGRRRRLTITCREAGSEAYQVVSVLLFYIRSVLLQGLTQSRLCGLVC